MKVYAVLIKGEQRVYPCQYFAAETFGDAYQGVVRAIKDADEETARILNIEELGAITMWLRKAKKVL